jgi:hypothetical protein
MLLWIDKISIPHKILNTIKLKSKRPEDKIVQLIMEFYERANLIEEIDTSLIFKESINKVLEGAVESDIKILTTLNPELSNVQEDGHFVINHNGMDYCFPKLLSLYGDLFLAKLVGANCLFPPESIEFCQLKFGLTNQNPINTTNTLLGIDKILTTIIPSVHPYPTFLSEGNKCHICAKENNCQQEYFRNLESVLYRYLEWRNYDEFHELRKCIDKVILATKKSSDIIMPDDVFNEFEREKNRINSLIHRRLPKVKKFSNLIASISVPASIFSAVNDAALPITISAAALSGASVLTSAVINHIEDKCKWINFTLKN